jgi:uncharacterized membrane protein (UPF0127 family)
VKTTYCVYNQTRESFLSLSVTRADTSLSRLKGLMGKFRMGAEDGIWLIPSQGVHTFGLFFPIDVVFLDWQHRVVDVVEHLRPFGASAIRLSSSSVLQLPAHSIFASGTKPGDQMLISLPEEFGIDLEKVKKRSDSRVPAAAMQGRAQDK